MKQITTRFAPSPTGFLHIGNTRTAIMNWLYARKLGGQFILRFDDTDQERSKKEYKDAIEKDLKWLGLNWDSSFAQSTRLTRYNEIKEFLLKIGRLYPCFETQDELEMKRKLQLSSGRPPIYDRAQLKLSDEQINSFIKAGRRPHYRFLIQDNAIIWHDLIKGEMRYDGSNLSDPIVIREDGSLTYMLCSVIDDIDYNISDIIRGEDHLTNTAIQVQMFEALDKTPPNFAHLSLVKAKEEKISKRVGGFEIKSLKEEVGLEAMAINSFFSLIGTSNQVAPYKTLKNLVQVFDISTFSKSPTTYLPEELMRLNHKLILSLDYEEVKKRIDSSYIDEKFWLAVRPNLEKLGELDLWWKICHNPEKISNLDPELLNIAASTLPNEITENTWSEWTTKITNLTGKKGKELFLPLRLALTGMDHGPELKNILPLLSREEILKRL